MIVLSSLQFFAFMNYLESKILCWFILTNLINKHAFELNKIRWIHLSFMIIYKQTLVSQNIISFSHNWSSSSYFMQFTLFYDFWIQGHYAYLILTFKKLTLWNLTFFAPLFNANIILVIIIIFFLFVFFLFLLIKIFLIISSI